MQDKPVALVTGANQGIGLQIARDLVTHGFAVPVGSRNLKRGDAAAREVTKTNLNGYAGAETVEEGAAEAVRVALLGPDGPTGTFTYARLGTLPW